jgi:hypothetical protein
LFFLACCNGRCWRGPSVGFGDGCGEGVDAATVFVAGFLVL